jgi:uncharacterized protein
VIKPIGPACNLSCSYCFYLGKTKLYPETNNFKITDNVLETFIENYLKQETDEITFIWQGGEPTLLGVEFFKKVVSLQKEYNKGKRIQNSLQTNGTLIDDNWAEFFKENNFLVGISLDGPERLHDVYRRDKKGNGSFPKVMKAIDKLYEYKVDYNILCCVNDKNVKYPKDVYDFLKSEGKTNFWQFIPIVERDDYGKLKDFSASSEEFGEFLKDIFKRWVKKDLGRISIQIFDNAFNIYAGLGATTCIFAETCGNALAMEHNGDLYSCDHFVDKNHLLGNILENDLNNLVCVDKQISFGLSKKTLQPSSCKNCAVNYLCNCECPKNRFVHIKDEYTNYLCEGYKSFFTFIDPYIRFIVGQIANGASIKAISKYIRENEHKIVKQDRFI